MLVSIIFYGCGSNYESTDKKEPTEQNIETPKARKIPNLTGIKGIVVIEKYATYYHGSKRVIGSVIPSTPWYFHPKKEIGPNNYGEDESKRVYHKSKALIIGQELKEKYSRVSSDSIMGDVLVKIEEDTFRIDIENIILTELDEKGIISTDLDYGNYLGVFNGKARPVNTSNEYADIELGDTVLINDINAYKPTGSKIPEKYKYKGELLYNTEKHGLIRIEAYFVPESIELIY